MRTCSRSLSWRCDRSTVDVGAWKKRILRSGARRLPHSTCILSSQWWRHPFAVGLLSHNCRLCHTDPRMSAGWVVLFLR